jgi:uncharacterized membrane protein YhaH (DUF805 family)
MDIRYQLVFAGELVEGREVQDVRERLRERLRLDDGQLGELMTARRKTIKRGLDLDQALRWRDSFATLGARLHIEPMTDAASPRAQVPPPAPAAPPPLSLVADEPAPPAPAAPDPQQQALADAERAERRAAALRRRGLRTETARSPSEAVREGGQLVPLLSLSYEGRIGRMRNLQGALMAITGLLWLVVLVARLQSLSGLLLLGVGALLISLWSTRMLALRVHDLGHSGWWTLLLFIPVFGNIVGLILSLVPGDTHENEHGLPPDDEHPWQAVVWAVLLSLTLSLGWNMMTSAYRREVARRQDTQRESAEEADAVRAMNLPADQRSQLVAALGGEQAADEYLGYLQAGPHRAFASGGGGAWGWQAGKADVRAAMEQASADCDRRRPAYTARCRIVSVDGQGRR